MHNFKIEKNIYINKSCCGQCRQFPWPGGGGGVAQKQYDTVYSSHFNMVLYQFTDIMSTQYAFEDYS